MWPFVSNKLNFQPQKHFLLLIFTKPFSHGQRVNDKIDSNDNLDEGKSIERVI